eukprot:jgi/Bigna1/89835/estExt_fgenesh1_pg.C_560089
MAFVPCTKDGAQYSHKGYLLVVPAVSVGNVGQIAMDLLLSTSKMKKIGYWHSPHVVSVICNDPLATKLKRVKGRIALPVEFHRCQKRKLVLMQRRSPLVKGGAAAFVQSLLKWATKEEFAGVVLASSSLAYVNENSQKQKFWCTYANIEKKVLDIVGEMKIDVKSAALDQSSKDSTATTDGKKPGPTQQQDHIQGNGRQHPPPPTVKEMLAYGTGITKELIKQCGRSKIPFLAILAQVNEGDNLADGKQMAIVLSKLLKSMGDENAPKLLLDPPKIFRIPFAYEHVYGPEPDRRIYT